MRRAAVGMSIVALLLFAHPGRSADKAAPTEWAPAVMMQVKQVGNVQVSPDGKHVVYSVRRAVMDGDKSEYQTHIYQANAGGSEVRQLTQGDKSCSSPLWSPDGKTIAFLSDRGGKRNIWLLPTHGGEARVPLSQGQELYNALKRQGCTTRMVLYPRTPHGIEEPKLLVDSMNRNLQWFEQHIGTK